MRFELWSEGPPPDVGDWTVFGVGEDYEHQRAVTDPKLQLALTFEADSFDEAMQIAHEFVGLPPWTPPEYD